VLGRALARGERRALAFGGQRLLAAGVGSDAGLRRPRGVAFIAFIVPTPALGRAEGLRAAALRAAVAFFPGAVAAFAVVAPCAARFFGTCTALSSIGRGRYSTSSLPIDCTAVQPSAEQISVDIVWRCARSSPSTRTLISSCARSARSVSSSTARVRPASPIMMTGSR